jgi:hypothetical protein
MSKSPYRYEVQDSEARPIAAFVTAVHAVDFVADAGSAADGWRVVDPDTLIVLWIEGMNGRAADCRLLASDGIEHRWYMSRASRRMAQARARRSEVSLHLS